MYERGSLTNIRMCRDNIRISFCALILAVMGIVAASHHWYTYWQMSHSLQLTGYVIGLILLIGGALYSLIFLTIGVIETINRSKLDTLLMQMGGIFADLLLLMLNIPIVLSMYEIVIEGNTGGYSIGYPIALAVVAIGNFAMDAVILRKARDEGIEPGGKHSPYHLFPVEQVKSYGYSAAKAPAGPKRVAFCPHCGSPVKEGAKFCGVCGKELPKEGE